MELLVLDHHPNTGVCRFADVLDGRRDLVDHRTLAVADGAPLPDVLDDVAGIVSMGGPQSATEVADHPWMRAEADLLRRAVDAHVPVFGVCLGAQLLGIALGGQVTRRPVPEVGYLPLTRTAGAADDEVVAGWPDGTAALFVHEDEVSTLPPDAEALLTGNDGVPAWRVASAWAVQAHPEVDAAQLEAWVGLERLQGLLDAADVDGAALVAEARRRERFAVATGSALFGRFVDGPVRKRVTGSAR